MELKHTVETIFKVDYYDLEKLINKLYGVNYEMVADQEWGNDESHFTTLVKRELSPHQKRLIENFKAGKCMYALWAVLQDMCNNGNLDEGKYLINISW